MLQQPYASVRSRTTSTWWSLLSALPNAILSKLSGLVAAASPAVGQRLCALPSDGQACQGSARATTVEGARYGLGRARSGYATLRSEAEARVQRHGLVQRAAARVESCNQAAVRRVNAKPPPARSCSRALKPASLDHPPLRPPTSSQRSAQLEGGGPPSRPTDAFAHVDLCERASLPRFRAQRAHVGNGAGAAGTLASVWSVARAGNGHQQQPLVTARACAQGLPAPKPGNGSASSGWPRAVVARGQ